MAAPVPVNEGQTHSATNPHTWLALVGDPAGEPGPRCMCGTLRPTHQGQANSAANFARSKINPLAGSAATDWTVAAHAAEVILPRHAPDHLSCAKALFEAVDAEHPSGGKALVTYVTLTWVPNRLHHQWKVGRALAAEIAREHDVAVLVVHHVPSRVASGNAPHVHLMVAGPRRITVWGDFGAYVPELMGDKVWAAMRARFHALLADARGEVA